MSSLLSVGPPPRKNAAIEMQAYHKINRCEPTAYSLNTHNIMSAWASARQEPSARVHHSRASERRKEHERSRKQVREIALACARQRHICPKLHYHTPNHLLTHTQAITSPITHGVPTRIVPHTHHRLERHTLKHNSDKRAHILTHMHGDAIAYAVKQKGLHTRICTSRKHYWRAPGKRLTRDLLHHGPGGPPRHTLQVMCSRRRRNMEKSITIYKVSTHPRPQTHHGVNSPDNYAHQRQKTY